MCACLPLFGSAGKNSQLPLTVSCSVKQWQEVERERDKLKMVTGELKASSESTINGLNERIDMMETEAERLEAQLKTFDKIQGAMVNMLFEVRQRAESKAEGGKASPAGKEGAVMKERAALMRGSPMIVLDQFRSQVRQLLGAKDDYEHRLQLELKAAGERFDLELQGLRSEVDQLRRYKLNAEGDKAKVLAKVEKAEQSQLMVVNESRGLVESMKADAHRLVSLVQEKEGEIAALGKKIKTLGETIEEQEAKMLEFGQIEEPSPEL